MSQKRKNLGEGAMGQAHLGIRRRRLEYSNSKNVFTSGSASLDRCVDAAHEHEGDLVVKTYSTPSSHGHEEKAIAKIVSDWRKLSEEVQELFPIHQMFPLSLYNFSSVPTHTPSATLFTNGGLSLLEFMRKGISGVVANSLCEELLRLCNVGLAYMHMHNIYHCDIKAGNILVAESGGCVTLKIIDFDHATFMCGNGGRAKVYAYMCTPETAPPEQLLFNPFQAFMRKEHIDVGHLPNLGFDDAQVARILKKQLDLASPLGKADVYSWGMMIRNFKGSLQGSGADPAILNNLLARVNLATFPTPQGVKFNGSRTGFFSEHTKTIGLMYPYRTTNLHALIDALTCHRPCANDV